MLSRLRSCVATSFLVFNLFLCRNWKISVATSKHLLSLKYVATLTLPVTTRSVHPLSTLCRDLDFLVVTQTSSSISFLSQQTFHVAKVSIATDECSVQTDILPSVQLYVATQTILFPDDLKMLFPFSVTTCYLLSRPSSIVNN